MVINEFDDQRKHTQGRATTNGFLFICADWVTLLVGTTIMFFYQKRDHKQYDDNRANTSEQNRKKFGRSNIEMVLLNRKKLAFTLICHVMTWVIDSVTKALSICLLLTLIVQFNQILVSMGFSSPSFSLSLNLPIL